MSINFSQFSLSKLVGMLHDAISTVSRDLDQIVEGNKEFSLSDVETLREHIEERLKRGEDVKENKQIIKLIDLFLTDKYVLEFIKGDSEEWLSFINAITEAIDKGQMKTKEGREEVYATIKELEAMLRK